MNQPFPSDLEIKGVAGGLEPGVVNRSLHLTADGKGKYTEFVPGEVGRPPKAEQTFEVDTLAP